MGTWNSGLFCNDTTMDIRDTYLQLLKQQKSNEEAYEKTFEEYKELLGTDEEPLFWYALADTQWRVGRLIPIVKEKALLFIEGNGGISLWEENKKGYLKFQKVLQNLKDKIMSPMPPEKKFAATKAFIKNPWSVGDVYAYKFHTPKADKNGLINKYILFQKIGNVEYYKDTVFSAIQVFDKVFDAIPSIKDIKSIRVLPLLCAPEKGKLNAHEFIPSFEYYLKATMLYEKERHYPKKHLTFIGNVEFDEIHCIGNQISNYDWDQNWMEDWLVDFYLSWQNVEY